MRLIKMLSCAMALGLGVASAASGQAYRDPQPPSEIPPSFYKGEQFVDSAGCVYIRAGLDGNVTWVPRVTRQRRQLCGQQPTPFGAQQQTLAAAPAAQPAQAVPRPATAPPARPASTPRAVTSRTATAPLVVPPGLAPLAPGSNLLAPKHVVATRAEETPVRMPKGYIKAWDDDRLNPNRAIGTAEGWAAMDRLWSRTVPRRQKIPAPVAFNQTDPTVITRNARATRSLAGDR